MRRVLFFLSVLSVGWGETVKELKDAVNEALPDILGWCSKEKASHFIDLVLEVKPDFCVEIGVFGGASFLPVAAALDFLGHGIAAAIDPWDKIECIRYLNPDSDKKNLQWWADLNLDHIYFGFLNLMRQFELQKTCVVVRSTSKKAAPMFGSIDILHIDGNHYEPAVIEDVRLYLPKVRQGGYIWLNDAKWSSSRPAVDLLLESCDVVKSVDDGNCILFRKRCL